MVVVAALGGFVPAFVCAITGFLLANWYFTPPYYELTISEGENLVALVIFLLVGGVVSVLVATASRRTAEAAQARAEAETLAALSGTVSASDDPLPQLVGQLRLAFDADGVAVLSGAADGESWQVLAGAGDVVPQHPDDADVVVPLHGAEVLVLRRDTSATTTGRCCGRSPARWRSRCSSASCGPTPSGPSGWPRPTSCAPPCWPRCRTTSARRCRRSRRR